jgi:hypothetical protein
MRFSLLAATAAIALSAAAGSMISTAEAQPRRDKGSDYGYVTAESRYGPQTIAAPVRRGSHGRLEVRLPGGTWIECGRSCRDTLRRETIDFWHSRSSGSGTSTDGPGYLQYRFHW